MACEMTTTWRRRALAAGLSALAIVGSAAAETAAAAESAVVVMYHRFGESAYSSTNITLEQFDAHIAELMSGKYTVMPLPEIVAAIRDGRSLPDRTVGITIDDAYASVYAEAWPRLKAAGLPFTLFVATEPVDAGLPGYVSWDQIREMAAAGVTIGHHTVTHIRLQTTSAERVAAEIRDASNRYRTELGQVPTIFAYPYGEYSLEVRQAVIDAGFAAAFGQQSGVAHAGADLYALPRFPFSESYGEIERFRLAVNALPIPVSELTPQDPVLSANPPMLGFTVDASIRDPERIACYASGHGRTKVEFLEPSRIEVRMSEPFPPGRVRINCTMSAGEGRWRWFGTQYLVPGD